MHPADITAALKKQGHSQTDVARAVCGRSGGPVTAGAVHLVIKGGAKSLAIALKISELTGLAIHALWPGKYAEQGQAKRRATARASTRRRT